VRDLRAAGKTVREIAAKTGLSKSRVGRLLSPAKT
jgi:transcriptional regulator with XRE-family HTH domain